MNIFDENILTISRNIVNNISLLTEDSKGFFAQNILKELRDLVEAIDQRIYSDVKPGVDLNDYDEIPKAINYVASRGDLKFLSKFHDFLQASVSHYTLDEDSSIRLMLKYYEWLIRIREYVKVVFGLEILGNLEDYPLYQDESLLEYYQKISEVLDNANYKVTKPSQRFYIQKSKPFFVKGKRGKIYYELTVVSADDYSGKFNRFTVFSNKEIPVYYAIKLDFLEASIDIIERDMPIRIVNSFKVAIRPIELTDISGIMCEPAPSSGTKEYYALMDFLTETGMSLVDIIDLGDKYYAQVKEKILKQVKSDRFFNLLDKCRKISRNKEAGYNIVRYLLLKLRHKIMFHQCASRPNNWISDLCLKNECIPFDKMPYDASLSEHNPSLYDLYSCINSRGREHEILSRAVRLNTEQNIKLFSLIDELKEKDHVDKLSQKFNSLLRTSHKPKRSLIIDKKHIFINGYVDNTVNIINNLISRKGTGLKGYSNSIESWMDNNPSVDSAEKKEYLKRMFSQFDIALIYGAAGTGKTTLIKHLSSYFANESKLFLANTNPAKENLRRQIKVSNCEFSTIASSKALVERQAYDIVFVDECSTVDNRTMRNLLERLQCRLLVLVGDVYQIQSVKFGNWFSLARYFLPQDVIYELKTPYRSTNNKLIGLWDRVRVCDEKMTEYILRNKYSANLDKSLFQKAEEDEIILCLNYDGLYGINNINRFLQSDNPNRAVSWDSWIYKVNDPVIFNEYNRFYPILYNNLKGWIRRISKGTASIEFDIEVDMPLTEFEASTAGFDLIDCQVKGHSLIRFSVDNYVDDDTGERGRKQVVPFQVAYAISIHKAQGLEYDSVKIIVTNEIEDLITHNIFYTAITRARKRLKIYWTPESQEEILSSIKPISNKHDACILAAKYGLKMLNQVD